MAVNRSLSIPDEFDSKIQEHINKTNRSFNNFVLTCVKKEINFDLADKLNEIVNILALSQQINNKDKIKFIDDATALINKLE